MSKIIRLSFLCLLLLGLSPIAAAQSTTAGAIGGVVSNPNKEVVPGASVTVRNAETNKEESERSPQARKVYASFTKFQQQQREWTSISMGSYHRLVNL